mmetsp:Transcript_35469/g.82304  ORF Transcript_35469/g.82304 Transcript_35469/m.82304 type:complete len:122 (+) Transcript_35469:5357-5722(+)
MSLGEGAVYCTSTKQKMNTKSSTEAEVVGVAHALTHMLWLSHFMKEQGYENEVLLNQDKLSSIKMEVNRLKSCGKRSRHMNIRYFMIKDYVDRGLVRIERHGAENMLADYMSKPLQGGLLF